MKATRKTARRRKSSTIPGMVDFNFGDTQYQVDPTRRKVYHKWVEVETARTFLIMGAFSSSQAQAK